MDKKQIEHLILSPEYEDIFEARYGKQPKCIPIGYVSNSSIPNNVERKRFYSRTWVTNPKYRKNSE